MPYLLDADTLIRAKNEHYGFDLCPGFWEWLVKSNEQGVVFSIQAILDDLGRYTRTNQDDFEDELAHWARERGSEFFLQPNSSTFYAMQRISAWARTTQYRDAAVREFLAVSDSWLVAEGHARGFTVVTHEVSSPRSIRRIKIPDACNAQAPPVQCITVFEMLRREQAVFSLVEEEGQISQ